MIRSPGVRMAIRSITLRSSRTFPGQRYSESDVITGFAIVFALKLLRAQNSPRKYIARALLHGSGRRWNSPFPKR